MHKDTVVKVVTKKLGEKFYKKKAVVRVSGLFSISAGTSL